MNAPNKRKLLVAAQALVHTNAPELSHFTDVGNALAQVFSDEMGLNVRVVFKVKADDAAELLGVMSHG